MNRIKELKALLDKQSNNLFIMFALAKEYEKEGKPNISIRYFERIIELSPEELSSYYNLGILYESLGQREKSINMFKKGSAIAKINLDFEFIPLFDTKISMP